LAGASAGAGESDGWLLSMADTAAGENGPSFVISGQTDALLLLASNEKNKERAWAAWFRLFPDWPFERIFSMNKRTCSDLSSGREYLERKSR
jgi:hypothetical protein